MRGVLTTHHAVKACCLITHTDNIKFTFSFHLYMGRDSAVGIETRYGLDGPGIESRWGEIFRTRPDRPWGPPSLLYNGYRVFPGGKAAGAWSWKGRAIPLLTLWAFVACYRENLYVYHSIYITEQCVWCWRAVERIPDLRLANHGVTEKLTWRT